MPLEPWTVRGVMGIDERAREPRAGARIDEGVEVPLDVFMGVEERRERNCELFILRLSFHYIVVFRRFAMSAVISCGLTFVHQH